MTRYVRRSTKGATEIFGVHCFDNEPELSYDKIVTGPLHRARAFVWCLLHKPRARALGVEKSDSARMRAALESIADPNGPSREVRDVANLALRRRTQHWEGANDPWPYRDKHSNQ